MMLLNSNGYINISCQFQDAVIEMTRKSVKIRVYVNGFTLKPQAFSLSFNQVIKNVSA